MKRIYTEIRIHHGSLSEKAKFERQLDDKVKASGFSSRAEYFKVMTLNSNIGVATNAREDVKMMTNNIRKYWENSFQSLTGEEIEEIVNYICENQVPAPVLYRGINIDPDTIDVGDTIDLHDMEAFVSMSPDLRYAWAFGNVILKVEGLEGCPINEKEWLVLNTDIYIENIEYDDRNDIYIVSCR